MIYQICFSTLKRLENDADHSLHLVLKLRMYMEPFLMSIISPNIWCLIKEKNQPYNYIISVENRITFIHCVTGPRNEFLGMLRYMRKAPIVFKSPRSSLCPSVQIYQRDIRWTCINEIWYRKYSRKFVEKSEHGSNQAKISVNLHQYLSTCYRLRRY